MIKQVMASSFLEAFKEAKFMNDPFEKDRVKYIHEQNRCHELGRDTICPYCHISKENKPQLTSEMIEIDNDFFSIRCLGIRNLLS